MGVAALRPAVALPYTTILARRPETRSGHRGTTQDDPHSNVTFIQSEYNDRMTTSANNAENGKIRRIATLDCPALSSPEVT
jgi:hypothetical protein